MRLTTHFHLVLRLRMSAVIPPFPLYAFMTCKDNFIYVIGEAWEVFLIKTSG
jgi:hypothetical protein